ncbi:MAG: uroporphyrinogen decarboxylase [Clostridia bacterium]|nr:uroporphyrinogen decarboxylase [Clostridia bacterium]
MIKKQRILNSLNHKESDIIPYQVDFTIEEHRKMAVFLNDDHFEDKIENHIHRIRWNDVNEELPDKKGHFRDFFGAVWNRSGVDKDIGVIDDPVFKNPDISLFTLPRVNPSLAIPLMEEDLKIKSDHFIIGDIGFSLFERAWSLRGFQNLLTDMVLDPVFVHELLDEICEANIEVIKLYEDYPVDGFYFGDDWGQQHGLIMGPANWREFILPRLKRMYDQCHSQGLYVMQHSCGDISEIFPDLIDAGLNAYNTVQPEIYDLNKLKKEYGNDLTFWGAISTQALLPFATPEVVSSETRRIMDILGKNGGYIAAPTHAVPYDVPCENIVAMLDVFKNQEKK